jgi:hypothetical protein
VGHGAIGEVAEGLVKRGVRAAGEGVSKAIADFHRATAKGLENVAERTRKADARAAKSFKDLEHRHAVPRPRTATAPAAFNEPGKLPGVGSIRKVNPRTPGEPGFGSGVPNRFENCARCAVATDRTLAGKPGVAEPSLATSPRWIEAQVGGRFGPRTTHQAIHHELAAAGPGARGIVIAYDNGVGHAFNVVNQGGVVRFLDGQIGGAADLSPWKAFHLLRTN